MNYAYIVDGAVWEVITPRQWDIDVFAPDGETIIHHVGDEIAITDRYTPEFLSQCFAIPEGLDVQQRWTFDGTTFALPVPYQPTPEEIKASNTAQRIALMAQASQAIAPLQYAVDLEEATDAEAALLKAWKKYSIAVNRIDVTLNPPPWPNQPV